MTSAAAASAIGCAPARLRTLVLGSSTCMLGPKRALLRKFHLGRPRRKSGGGSAQRGNTPGYGSGVFTIPVRNIAWTGGSVHLWIALRQGHQPGHHPAIRTGAGARAGAAA